MSNTTRFAFAYVFGSIASLVGCAADSNIDARPPTTAPIAAMTSDQPHQHAECFVCKYNADLACVDVDVDRTTPRYDYNGKTYYFCSEECRNELTKNPTRYAPLAGK